MKNRFAISKKGQRYYIKKMYQFVNEQDAGLNLTICTAACSQKDQEGKLENIHKRHRAKKLKKG